MWQDKVREKTRRLQACAAGLKDLAAISCEALQQDIWTARDSVCNAITILGGLQPPADVMPAPSPEPPVVPPAPPAEV